MADTHAQFDQLYRQTRRDVLAYLVRRAGNPDDAAELLSDVYLIAWQRLDDLPAGDQARLWLFGVARNLLHKRRAQRRSADRLTAALGSVLRTVQPNPARDDDLHGALRRALSTLAEVDREIVLLTAWEQLTPREIAQIINASPNAIRIRLHRARIRLQDQLADGEEAQSQAATEITTQ